MLMCLRARHKTHGRMEVLPQSFLNATPFGSGKSALCPSRLVEQFEEVTILVHLPESEPLPSAVQPVS
jgi:hypothetical protein